MTGGAGGIGGALCQALADRGAVVVVADIDGAAADRLASTIAQAGGRIEVRCVDVGREAAVQSCIDETVARHGRLDYMFNAAGVAVIGELRDITADHCQSWTSRLAGSCTAPCVPTGPWSPRAMDRLSTFHHSQD